MKTSQKVNDEMKQIQFKYKNDPEKLNQEVMALYKREKISPFSGCFSAIIQFILLNLKIKNLKIWIGTLLVLLQRALLLKCF